MWKVVGDGGFQCMPWCIKYVFAGIVLVLHCDAG